MRNIGKKNIRDILTLTPMQEGMLFHFLKDPESDYYMEQLSLEISGDLELSLFEDAWNSVIRTNEMLRTVFRWEKVKSPLQVILKEHRGRVIFYDLSTREKTEKEKRLEDIKSQDRETKFDLRDVPFRLTLCKIADNHFYLILGYHHILLDGWSMGIILKEFFEVYGCLSRGEPVPKTVKTPFKAFIQWNRERDGDKEEAFWRGYLEGFESRGGLPLKAGGNEDGTGRSEIYQTRLGYAKTGELANLSRENKVTLAALLYLSWGLLLQKYVDRGDVLFGTTVSGRSAKVPGIENMVGLFINTLPLRVRCKPGDTVGEVLRDLNETLRVREAYESTPLLKINRYRRGSPNEELFDSLVVVENYPLDIPRMQENVSLRILSHSMVEATHYNLTATIRLSADIDIHFSYRNGEFDDGFIRRLSSHFLRLLDIIRENPDLDVREIDILSREEKQQILERFNDTHMDYLTAKTLHRLVGEQAEKRPDDIAAAGVVLGMRESFGHLSYRRLNEDADEVASRLREKGVGLESIVGIKMERSVEMLIAMLGILKAGAAYLPIDPDYPRDRIDYMLKDSGANMVVDGTMLAGANGTAGKKEAGTPGNLAYVIYTSGSTGRPKGVMIRHRSVINFITGMADRIEFAAGRRCLALTTIAFDIFVLETWLPLVKGKQVVVAAEIEQIDSRLLSETITRHRIDILQLTPSRLKLLLDGKKDRERGQSLDCLREVEKLIVGGEAFPVHLFNFLRRTYRGDLYNVYGPTETTVWSTIKKLPSEVANMLTIGTPIVNTVIYIVDRFGHFQPVGIAGELLIGGDGVARGYLNKPELTAEKFYRSYRIYKSYNAYSLYRTGDLARWLPDGDIEFLGRIDHQVKIRGFRIELEEIETLLLKHENIKETVVVEKETTQGDNYLCAYVVPKGRGKNAAKLREYLSQTLPSYSIPTYFVSLEKIPLTPNGKIDRNALPEPRTGDKSNLYEAPRNEIEQKLVEVWSQVLGVTEDHKIGINDNFFQLGGDSIKAIRISSRLQEAGLELKINRLFSHPVIKDLVNQVTPIHEKKTQKQVPLLPPEIISRMTGYIAHRIPGDPVIESMYPLNPTQKAMVQYSLGGTNKDVYLIRNVIRWEGPLKYAHLETALNTLIAKYDIFRTVFVYEGLDEPLQVVLKHRKAQIDFEDISHLTEGEQLLYLEQAGQNHGKKGFDPGKDILVKLSIFKIGGDAYRLLWTHHYILMDGWSMGIFFNELFQLLEELKKGHPVRLKKAPPYRDYVRWLEERDKSAAFRYWKNYLDGYEHRGGLLPGTPAAPLKEEKYSFKDYTFEMSGEETEGLNRLAASCGVTVNIVFQSMWGILLRKYSSRDDVLFGAVVSGRPPEVEGIEEMVGLFICTVPVRVNLPQDRQFSQLLNEMQGKSTASKPYEYLQFTQLLSHLELKGNIIDTLMTFQNFPFPGMAPGRGVSVETHEQSNYNLNIVITPVNPIHVKFIYNASVYGKDFLDGIRDHLIEILRRVIADKDVNIGDIRLTERYHKADTTIFQDDDEWAL